MPPSLAKLIGYSELIIQRLKCVKEQAKRKYNIYGTFLKNLPYLDLFNTEKLTLFS